ncbi:hypothetical protein FB451DRAFT_1516799 [Mycena latifolia]|nr:hypothetical protein FB451DRAFT_1516799 [Mycena latifolia]
MALTFADIYGTDVNNLSNWQSLCTVLELEPVPQTLWECRAAVRGVHVNLVDLVDLRATGITVQNFESQEELAEYTELNNKWFPQARAEDGGLLVFLLRYLRSYVSDF